MKNFRLIAKLDIKAPNLVKGVQLEGLRKIGDPNQFAFKYYNEGIDEIIYEDIVASLYNRNSLLEIIEKTAQNIFVPLTVGGGLRSLDDVSAVLRAGADKISINTAAIKYPELISQISEKFGSQCVVVSIQAKFHGTHWEAYYENGREHSGLDVLDWARKVQQLGAGELVITSIDNEGTKKGFDINLINAVADVVSIPLIANGGMGSLDDINNLSKISNLDAVAMSSVLHYNNLKISDIRSYCIKKNISVREI